MRHSKNLIFTLLILLVSALGIFAATSATDTLTYHCKITALFPQPDGIVTKKSIPATLKIQFPENAGGEPRASMETIFPKGALLLKVKPSQIPDEVQGIFIRRKYLYFTLEHGTLSQKPQSVVLDLCEPVPPMYSKIPPSNLHILDARGNPAKGFVVNLFMRYTTHSKSKEEILLDSAALDDSGSFKIHYPQTVYSPQERGREKSRITRGLILRVRHPANGEMQRFFLPHFRYIAGEYQMSDAVSLFMVLPDAEERGIPEDVFAGEVVDYQGRPVKGARISVYSLILKSGVDFILTPYSYTSYPDLFSGDGGAFKISIPRDILEEKTGVKDVPSNARLLVTVTPSAELKTSLGEGSRRLSVGKKSPIVLPYAEKLTFRFLAENGRPLNILYRGKYYTPPLRIFSVDQTTTEVAWYRMRTLSIRSRVRKDSSIEVWPIPLPGRYEIMFQDSLYKAQTLCPGAGKQEIVWTTESQPKEKDLLCKGRVLDVHTGRPVSGTYIILSSQDDACKFVANMTDEERERIWADIPTDGRLREIPKHGIVVNGRRKRFFQAYAIGKTNASGEYTFKELHPKVEAIWYVNIWAPGKVGLSGLSKSIRKRGHLRGDNLQIPDAVLLPAASVKGKLLPPYVLPDPYLRKDVQRHIDAVSLSFVNVTFERAPDWALDSSEYIGKNKIWRMVTTNDYLQVNWDFQLDVPAGVLFSIDITPSTDVVLKGVSWKNLALLREGEILSLPPKEIELKHPFIIKVLNADGTPAGGVSVGININPPVVSDEGGIVIGWSEKSRVRFNLKWEKDDKVIEKRMAIHIPQTDGVPIVKVRLEQKE